MKVAEKEKGKEEEEEEELDCCKCNCCIKRSITFILIFIIIFSSMGILMHIIYLPVITWDYVSVYLFALSFVSLFFLCVILGFDIVILLFRRHLYKNTKKYILSKIFSLVILILNPILVILDLFITIMVSVQLHIADYPEYGGRERDEEYIITHPDEFGAVSGGEFLIAGMCLSISAFAQLISIFFGISLFRRVYYLPENYQNEKKQSEVRVVNEEENENGMDIGYKKNLKMIKTDDRLYPNKTNLPNDLKYSTERVFSDINNNKNK